MRTSSSDVNAVPRAPRRVARRRPARARRHARGGDPRRAGDGRPGRSVDAHPALGPGSPPRPAEVIGRQHLHGPAGHGLHPPSRDRLRARPTACGAGWRLPRDASTRSRSSPSSSSSSPSPRWRPPTWPSWTDSRSPTWRATTVARPSASCPRSADACPPPAPRSARRPWPRCHARSSPLRLRGVEQLPTLTARSHRHVAALLDELDDVRQRGYAVDDEETSEGIVCLGVAVPRRNARPRPTTR